jgi:pilus assembly protein CpaB
MNMKTWLPLCLALVLGLVAAKFAHDMMAKNHGPQVTNGKFVQVVVAKQPIGAGEALTSENCKLGNVDSDDVPQGSFRSLPDLETNKRVAQVQLGSGQPVTENLLAPIGTGVGLQAFIPQGMRAISIEVNEFSGVGGMLVPGCHVDVLATVPGENGGEMIARTIVQDIQVSAIGQRMVNQPNDKNTDQPQAFRSVTLLASPVEAEAIELAAASGRPRLVLRSGADKAIARTSGVTAANLRGSSAPKAAIPPIAQAATKVEPVYTTVRTIRGTRETDVRFDAGWNEAKITSLDQGETNKAAVSDTASQAAPATGH